MSTDSGQVSTLCTPSRTSQNATPRRGSSSSKRRLFREFSEVPSTNEPSDPDSDLGIMSPLDLTDKSLSPQSSPGTFQSPEPIDPKCFYGSQPRRSFSFCFPKAHEIQKRRSRSVAKQSRRRSKGTPHSGVSHGLKRPKLKPKSRRSIPEKRALSEPKMTVKKRPRQETLSDEENCEPEPYTIDPTKKFFKTVDVAKTRAAATVVINENVTLSLSKGRMVLGEVCNKQPSKKMRLDATDLLVEEFQEPEAGGSGVDRLLKLLTDEWGEDEMDTIGSALAPVTPGTFTPVKDTTMSPASELTNLTSVMKIQEPNKGKAPEMPKLYPLFDKGFKDHTVPDEKKPSRKRSVLKAGLPDDQYQLDVGQIKLRPVQCPECGVVYQQGDPDDENAHLNYHNTFKVLKFPGWKTERVMHEDMCGRVILVEPTDSKVYWNKVLDILHVVDFDLGLADVQFSYYQTKKVYLYIRERTVIGVLVAEEISTANHMMPEVTEVNCSAPGDTPAKCGINVVWTAMSHRRQGIASTLVDVVRKNFYYGYILAIEDIAFSMPTPSGRQFAQKYTKMPNFKVYQ